MRGSAIPSQKAVSIDQCKYVSIVGRARREWALTDALPGHGLVASGSCPLATLLLPCRATMAGEARQILAPTIKGFGVIYYHGGLRCNIWKS